jgi:SAM-dependent methyltransferase
MSTFPPEPDFLGVPLDTQTIPQRRLDIVNKERSNLFPWNGQFSPQLVEELLRAYAPANALVVDPFLGSGTVLAEAGRLAHAAFGSEINPAAFKMADAYTFINLMPEQRKRIVQTAADQLDDILPETEGLFATVKGDTKFTPDMLVNPAVTPADPHVRRLLETLIVILDVGRRNLDPSMVRTAWRKLRRVVAALPVSSAPIELANCDARRLPLDDHRADLVLTSPPYINVFNYHQQYRKAAESMGWNLLAVAKSEIGSNRKHRGNRFLTVTQYCLDMHGVFEELRRICKPGARVIIVVGRESNVRKTPFYNGEIVAQLAVRCSGFLFASRQQRVFQNRFGDWITEDILHFTLEPLAPRLLATAPALAEEILRGAWRRVPEESKADLAGALAKLNDVQSSPLYQPAESKARLPTKWVG